MNNEINTESLLLLKNHYPVFSMMSDKHLLQMYAQGVISTFRMRKGETREFNGLSDLDCYYLLAGTIRYQKAAQKENVLHSDSRDLKPLCLMSGERFVFTASDDSLLCRANNDEVDYMVSWAALVDKNSNTMNEVSARLMEMKNPAIFMKLPFEHVESAISRMQAIDVTAGDLIISQGDEANSFYLIESGQAEVIQQGIFDSVPSRVAVLGAGDHFGEEALIHGGARNATIRMLEDGRLLSLHKDDFTRLIGDELVKNISAEEALEDTKQEAAVFLDVRYEEEYYDTHLKGAKLISLPELRNRLDELDRATRYITCCNSTRRSSVAAMLLNKEGHEAVYLKGGIRAWPFEVIDEMALND